MPITIPQHEQSYPVKMLPHRLEEYVLNDKPPTTNRSAAVCITGADVLATTNKVFTSLSLQNIDPHYFVGTCFHESGGCLNEWDTEIATAISPAGFITVGPYQISEEEAYRFGFQLIDMVNLENATHCMVRLAEYNRGIIRAAAKLQGDPDPDYTDDHGNIWKGGTMRAYLAICHNHGTGYTRKTITNYGLDWVSYKKRNPTDNIVTHGYGEDCVNGGAHYPTAPILFKPGDRLLKIGEPLMVGEDVRELQRYLKVATDGIFGPDTRSALTAFQYRNFIHGDLLGTCGNHTWKIILGK